MTTAGTEPILNLPEGDLDAALNAARKAAEAQKTKATAELTALRRQRNEINALIRDADARLAFANRTLAALTPRKPRTTKAVKP